MPPVLCGIRWFALALLTALVFGITSCTPPEPVRIGFIGGLSGRIAELGTTGLSGVQLAVAAQNQKGGIDKRPIELVEADDRQDPEIARRAIDHLIANKVEAILGPMTSIMALATVDRANQARVVLLSPTVTTNALSGRDDHFFRIIPAFSELAVISARHAGDVLKLNRIRPIYDLLSRDFGERWIADYGRAFTARGGTLLPSLSFTSNETPDYAALARAALSERPEGILIVAGVVETAILCQALRQLHPGIPISTTEWAATDRLLALGGEAVEGVALPFFFDPQSTSPAYVAFRDEYLKRYHRKPGYPELYAFDAANLLIEALRQRTGDQTLRDVLRSRRRFEGVQGPIEFDAFGDNHNNAFMATISRGAFVPAVSPPPLRHPD